MLRTKVLAAGLAVAIAGGTWAVARAFSLSDELRAAELARDRLEERAAASGAELSLAKGDLHRARARLERFARGQTPVQRLEAQLERASKAGCFEESGRPSRDARGPIHGDVDGDGLDEAVYVIGLPRSSDRCAYHVLVARDDGLIGSARVLTARHATDPQELRFYLKPSSFVELNGIPGYEVLVVSGVGATGAGYQIFTFLDGELARLARPGPNGWAGFGAFASAGHGSGMDCVGPARIVMSHYVYSNRARHHRVERSFFRVAGATLVPDGTETYARSDADRFPELTGGTAEPFPNCAKPR